MKTHTITINFDIAEEFLRELLTGSTQANKIKKELESIILSQVEKYAEKVGIGRPTSEGFKFVNALVTKDPFKVDQFDVGSTLRHIPMPVSEIEKDIKIFDQSIAEFCRIGTPCPFCGDKQECRENFNGTLADLILTTRKEVVDRAQIHAAFDFIHFEGYSASERLKLVYRKRVNDYLRGMSNDNYAEIMVVGKTRGVYGKFSKTGIPEEYRFKHISVQEMGKSVIRRKIWREVYDDIIEYKKHNGDENFNIEPCSGASEDHFKFYFDWNEGYVYSYIEFEDIE